VSKKKSKAKPGPKPNHLKIEEENLEDDVKKAIQKKKPKDGWPKKTNNANNKQKTAPISAHPGLVR